ncbi:MAG: carbohydrate kinase family protein [Bacteroidales bacterium]
MKKYDVVAAGHICLDITPAFLNQGGESFDQLFHPGKLINVGKPSIHTGGSVPNTGIAVQLLGIPTLLRGKIGQDLFGEVILSILRNYGMEEGILVDETATTSYSVVIAPRGIDRIFLHDPGANNTFSSDDIDYDAVARARLFHFGYPPLMRTLYQDNGRELAKIFRRVKAIGVTTSLDCTLPDPSSESGQLDWKSILSEVLPYVDIFCPSLEEALYMALPEDYKYFREKSRKADFVDLYDPAHLPKVGEVLTGMGCSMAFVKCGLLGCYLKTAGEDEIILAGKAEPANISAWADKEMLAPAFFIEKVASTTGCGDSAVAAFIVALLKGYVPEDALKIACGAGALTATVYDSLSGLVPVEKIEEKIRQGWEYVRNVSVTAPWMWDEKKKVFILK